MKTNVSYQGKKGEEKTAWKQMEDKVGKDSQFSRLA